MAKLNEKQKLLAFVGGGAFLCLAAGAGVWWAQGLVTEKQAEITTAEQAIATARGKIKQIPGLERDVIILRENVGHYERVLPNATEVTEFMRQVDQFAVKAGVQVDSYFRGAGGKRGSYSMFQYRLAFTGTLWEFLEFVNLFENHPRFVSIVSFDVRPADADEELQASMRGEDPEHGYTLVLETYTYTGQGAAQSVPIARYEQQRRDLREEIRAQRMSLPMETYQLSDAVGRRDIFVDPRPRVGGTGPSGNSRAMQEKLLEQFISEVAEVRGVHQRWGAERNYLLQQRLERQLRDALAVLDDRSANETPKMSDAAMFARWTQDVLTPLREMRREVEGVGGVDPTSRLTVEQIDALVAEMQAAIERGEFDAAIARHDEMRDRLAFGADDPRLESALRAEKLRLAVEAAVDFSEISLDIKGVAGYAEGRRVLLVNGKAYEEGDYVQDRLLLKTVGDREAEFVFRGFRLAKKW